MELICKLFCESQSINGSRIKKFESMVMFLNIRNYLLILLSLLAAANASVAWSDVSDRFNFKLGDQFSSVIMRMDITNPYDCEIRGGFYPAHFHKEKMFKKAPYSIFLGLENQDLLFVFDTEFDSECNLVTVEQMGFCRSTGELLMHHVNLPITEDELIDRMPAFDEDSDKFIGFSKNDALLDYSFRGELITFSVKNTQKNYLRESYLSLWGPTKNPFVDHILIKLPEHTNNSLSLKICPPGPDIISEFRPKYRNLDKLFSTGQFYISRFEQTRQLFNKCSVVFPDDRDRYTQTWKRFQDAYQDDFYAIQNKIEQILISIGDFELSAQYEKELEKEIRYLTSSIKYISENDTYNKEWCENFLGDDTLEIGKGYSKNYFDLDFVKDYVVVD